LRRGGQGGPCHPCRRTPGSPGRLREALSKVSSPGPAGLGPAREASARAGRLATAAALDRRRGRPARAVGGGPSCGGPSRRSRTERCLSGDGEDGSRSEPGGLEANPEADETRGSPEVRRWRRCLWLSAVATQDRAAIEAVSLAGRRTPDTPFSTEGRTVCCRTISTSRRLHSSQPRSPSSPRRARRALCSIVASTDPAVRNKASSRDRATGAWPSRAVFVEASVRGLSSGPVDNNLGRVARAHATRTESWKSVVYGHTYASGKL